MNKKKLNSLNIFAAFQIYRMCQIKFLPHEVVYIKKLCCVDNVRHLIFKIFYISKSTNNRLLGDTPCMFFLLY